MKKTNQTGSIGVFVAVGAILVVASLVVLYTIRQNTLSQNTSPISSDLVATEKKDKKDSQGSSAQQQPNKQGADSRSGGRGEARSDIKAEDTKSSSVDKGPAQPSVKSGKDLPKTGPEDLAVSVFAAGTLAFLITAYYRSRYLV